MMNLSITIYDYVEVDNMRGRVIAFTEHNGLPYVQVEQVKDRWNGGWRDWPAGSTAEWARERVVKTTEEAP